MGLIFLEGHERANEGSGDAYSNTACLEADRAVGAGRVGGATATRRGTGHGSWTGTTRRGTGRGS